MQSGRFESIRRSLGTINVSFLFLNQMKFVRNSLSSNPMGSCAVESPSSPGWAGTPFLRPLRDTGAGAIADSEEGVSCLRLRVHCKWPPSCGGWGLEGGIRILKSFTYPSSKTFLMWQWKPQVGKIPIVPCCLSFQHTEPVIYWGRWEDVAEFSLVR